MEPVPESPSGKALVLEARERRPERHRKPRAPFSPSQSAASSRLPQEAKKDKKPKKGATVAKLASKLSKLQTSDPESFSSLLATPVLKRAIQSPGVSSSHKSSAASNESAGFSEGTSDGNANGRDAKGGAAEGELGSVEKDKNRATDDEGELSDSSDSLASSASVYSSSSTAAPSPSPPARPKAPSGRPRSENQQAEIEFYARLSTKERALHVSLRQIPPFSTTELASLETFIVALRERRAQSPGSTAPSLGRIFCNADPHAWLHFYTTLERKLVLTGTSSNWSFIARYLSELVTWFNALAARTDLYTDADLLLAWRGQDHEQLNNLLDMWVRASSAPATKPASASAAEGSFPPCLVCKATNHDLEHCYALKRGMRVLKKKAPRKKKDSDQETEESEKPAPAATASSSKKKKNA